MDFEKLILENIDNPAELEKLFRADQKQFVVAFDKVFVAHQESAILKVWHERIHYQPTKKEVIDKPTNILLIILLSLFAGTVADLPNLITGIKEDVFYRRNIAFSVLPALAFYFIIKNRLNIRLVFYITLAFLGSFVYMNVLPSFIHSDSVNLSCLHLPFFLWSVVGIAFIGNDFKNQFKRMDYLRYNGELLVYSSIILVCGIILTFLTMGLFGIIGIREWEFFEFYKHIIAYGIAASYIVAIYITEIMGKVSKNIAPIIAKIFSPLVLITLVVYLFAIIILQKDPYKDRDFLTVFNAMLLTVLAITVFVISERGIEISTIPSDYINLALVLVALVINGIALSAIVFRVSSFGITPNRIAVLGSNLLVFVNLISISIIYIRFLLKKSPIVSIEVLIGRYLPLYSVWTIIVVFGFPFIFSFK